MADFEMLVTMDAEALPIYEVEFLDVEVIVID
jgi:hypothetical protein